LRRLAIRGFESTTLRTDPYDYIETVMPKSEEFEHHSSRRGLIHAPNKLMGDPTNVLEAVIGRLVFFHVKPDKQSLLDLMGRL
jgi:hypothetical protein